VVSVSHTRFNAPKGGNAVLTDSEDWPKYVDAVADKCFNAPKGGNAVLTGIFITADWRDDDDKVSMPRRAVMLF